VKINTIFTALVFLLIGTLTNSCDRSVQTCPIYSTPPSSEDLTPGNIILTLGPSADQREVVLHVPPQYDPNDQLPLLIVFHGAGQTGAGIREFTGMDAAADAYGFVVAYPNGSGRPGSQQLSWNAGHCCGYALANNIDDVGFTEALIDFFTSHYAIDPGRVYLTGLSNGGMMAYRAGAELADKVAGIAPVAASLGGRLVEGGEIILPDFPTSPVAVIAFNGMKDERVLYKGGISDPEKAPISLDPRSDISVADSIRFWVEANACSSDPSEEMLKDGTVIIDHYQGCQGNADVVLVTLVNGCHQWPSTALGSPAAQLPSDGVCANQMMLEFFLAHPKQK
jgi:polyhydroxybutyrate depolymerase